MSSGTHSNRDSSGQVASQIWVLRSKGLHRHQFFLGGTAALLPPTLEDMGVGSTTRQLY